MRPEHDLPLPSSFTTCESYVETLLKFVSSSQLLQLLTGGVHILDFFIREPDMYEWLLPSSWRAWFDLVDREDLLSLFTASNLEAFISEHYAQFPPPLTLVEYISTIRSLSLQRGRPPSEASLPRDVSLGMKTKKVHEVGLFAQYIDQLVHDISTTKQENITHLVDFGSGQNYLGRTLASRLYNRKVIAVESRHENVERARSIDVQAKIMPKTITWRNKKLWKEAVRAAEERGEPPPSSAPLQQRLIPGASSPRSSSDAVSSDNESIEYVEHRLQNGDLSSILPRKSCPSNILVMSLHSCGNLSHHGLRSLILNSNVRAVAIVGCCYNLVTERLSPPTYKLPSLRPPSSTSTTNGCSSNTYSSSARTSGDPHGYPMSARVCNYLHPSILDSYGSSYSPMGEVSGTEEGEGEKEKEKCGRREDNKGIHLNITARMMAVQAPQNWSPSGSDSFFTRHFFRALLQRVFMDRGVVPPPHEANEAAATQPIIIGCLRKHCYTSFVNYVRGAVDKLTRDPPPGFARIAALEKMNGITDAEIEAYAESYQARKKHLAIVWTLMAFSATLVEAVIVVDRWLWLKEQEEVNEAWVEPVWDYALSPRNLVVVGIKK